MADRSPRDRGGRVTIRDVSAESNVVQVVRDPSGARSDQIVAALHTPHLAAVLGIFRWSATPSTPAALMALAIGIWAMVA